MTSAGNDPCTPTCTVAVRALCEFTAKAGDLDLRFTPSPTALEGQEGHALVAARRGPAWQAELPLSGDFGTLRVRGRADGYDMARQRLEEIKTHRGRLDRQPANHRALHWAQLRIYGWLLCAQQGLAEVELALAYLDIGTQQETVFTERAPAAALQAHFEQRCRAYLAWAAQEALHRSDRDRSLETLRFPHPDFRPGQRPLAEAVYKGARAGRCLMAQAPTGIGKTVGTLFPLLKAMPAQRIDRVFFLTAKTSGRAMALHALETLRRSADLPLRTLELVARDKACEHPDRACHGESCPLARGFYDRLGAAREAALALPAWDRETVRALAATHTICPYYLTQELARWSDAVVGDYNHFFDSSALLHGLTATQDWRVALLVDEAHNLVDRARSMYSASLEAASLKRVRDTAPPALRLPLQRLQKRWKALLGAHPEDHQLLAEAPEALLQALQQAHSAIHEHLAEHPTEVDADLQGFLLDTLALTRLAESDGPHSLWDLTRSGLAVTLCLRNVVPAGFLAPRWAAAHSSTLFSATLQPGHYHRELLGLPQDTAQIDVESPFDSGQLAVHIARRLSTRYKDRAASLERIADLIAQQYGERPGHYLAFFSSYDYLEQVLACVEARHPGLPLWRQSRRMSEAEQAAFLARFVPGGRGVGFAVLGGAFAEGIDLPGDRLIGAFVATLGMPQVNPVNEQMRQRIDQLLGHGFDYTYLYPGLQKVVQAAGRVIRTPQDRGVVHLLDERFARREVRALLPAWWSLDGTGGGSTPPTPPG
ncbi:Rad3-related DNA helicase [Sphaerotilus hippei]|uniref:Rad3-related DNA helicase n=1 Tax=Sphaerotilus hippei TaxID=744406 RepID=A0A318H5P1_9BURK|nr:ATP-dependent DNA helicase [Sphaerotilus hippei]PXW99295.1 Rad3-related DNA helicase [Sphaerotilus hippei]